MTGREVLAAVKPLESAAKAILRFSEVAHAAIRLEEGLTQTEAALVTRRAALDDARVELALVQSETVNLAATLAAERAAAEHETAQRCAARVFEAEGRIAALQAKADEWSERIERATTEHLVKVQEWQTEEAALREHIDGLRAMAQRMAQAADAVLR